MEASQSSLSQSIGKFSNAALRRNGGNRFRQFGDEGLKHRKEISQKIDETTQEEITADALPLETVKSTIPEQWRLGGERKTLGLLLGAVFFLFPHH